MKLYQLRYFSAVCDCGYVTKAAEELHVSQPSVSNAIKELEDEFDINLFHRINNRLTPTEEGLFFLEHARKILEYADNTQNLMAELSSKEKQIKIGIPPMIGTFLFPKMFSDFKKQYPNIQLDLVEGGSPEMLSAVDDDLLDMAVIITNGVKNSEIHIEHMYDTEFHFCVGKNHRLANRDKISFDEIKNENLILFKNGYFQNKFIRSRFAEIGAEPNIILYSNQIITMQNLVREGIVCAFLIKEVVNNSDEIVHIPLDPPIPIEIGIIRRKNRRQGSAAIQFIKFVHSFKL